MDIFLMEGAIWMKNCFPKMKERGCVVDDYAEEGWLSTHPWPVAASRQALLTLDWAGHCRQRELVPDGRWRTSTCFLTASQASFFPWVTTCRRIARAGQGPTHLFHSTESWTARDMDRSAAGSLGCVQVPGPPWGKQQHLPAVIAKVGCHVKLAWQYQTMGECPLLHPCC